MENIAQAATQAVWASGEGDETVRHVTRAPRPQSCRSRLKQDEAWIHEEAKAKVHGSDEQVRRLLRKARTTARVCDVHSAEEHRARPAPEMTGMLWRHALVTTTSRRPAYHRAKEEERRRIVRTSFRRRAGYPSSSSSLFCFFLLARTSVMPVMTKRAPDELHMVSMIEKIQRARSISRDNATSSRPRAEAAHDAPLFKRGMVVLFAGPTGLAKEPYARAFTLRTMATVSRTAAHSFGLRARKGGGIFPTTGRTAATRPFSGRRPKPSSRAAKRDGDPSHARRVGARAR